MKEILAGIDIGGTTIKLAFLTEQGEIITKWEIPTNKADAGKGIFADIKKAVTDKLEELEIPYESLKSVGVGAPGPVDQEKGLLGAEPLILAGGTIFHFATLSKKR